MTKMSKSSTGKKYRSVYGDKQNMSKCERCGERPAIAGGVCGKCYSELTLKEQMKRQEIIEQQTDLLGEILESLAETLVGAGIKNKHGVETTIEQNGKTYGISFMVKELNEAEQEAWENATEE